MAAIPIFYSYGIQVAVLPTAILSTNTDYPDYVLNDQTHQMRASIKHWQKLGMKFDAIYSGFIGNPIQAELIQEAIASFSNEDTIILIDPVLGDEGKLYSCYNDSMIKAMQALLPHADIITPNLTEAAMLIGKSWNQQISDAELWDYCKSLQTQGARNIVITSAPHLETQCTAVALLMEDHSFLHLDCAYLPAVYPGAGDVFASVLLAESLAGKSLPAAAQAAVDFVYNGIQKSMLTGQDRRDGICLDLCLP